MIGSIESYNFAKVELIFGDTRESSSAIVSIIDADSITRARIKIDYKDLIFSSGNVTDYDCSRKINSRFKYLSEYVKYYYENPNRFNPQLYVLTLIGLIFATIAMVTKLILWILRKIISIMCMCLNKSKQNNKQNEKQKYD